MARQQQEKLDKLVIEAVDTAKVITEAVTTEEAITEAVDIAEAITKVIVEACENALLTFEAIDKIATSENPFFHLKSIPGSDVSGDAENVSKEGQFGIADKTTTHLFIDTLNLQLLYGPRITSSKNLSLVIKVERMKMKSNDTKWYTISNIVIPKAYLAFVQESKSPYNLEFQLEDEQSPCLFRLEQDPKSDPISGTKFAIYALLPGHRKVYLVPTEVKIHDQKGKLVGEIKKIIGEDDDKILNKYVFQCFSVNSDCLPIF